MPAPRVVANKEDLLSDIRTLIAKHLGVAVEYITLTPDFG